MPPALVMAANSRSVPTAVTGAMPNRKISRGVIKEPPPTPVSPTRAPTPKPAKINPSSTVQFIPKIFARAISDKISGNQLVIMKVSALIRVPD